MQQNSDQSLCVLGNASSKDVTRVPYSHLVVDHPVEDGLYHQLENEFPSPERFVKGMENVASNQAIRIPAADIIDNPEFSNNWRSFFRYHTSQAFWEDIVRVMGDDIRLTHPELEQRAGKRLEDWRAKLRGTDGDGDVELDALFVINTPVKKMSSVRPAHVDAKNKIFAGLYYMKPEDDPTPGGNLALYSFKDDKAGFGGHYADLADVNEDRVVEYTSNRFLAFINSPDSIHGVTPRPQTDRYRRYINFVAVTPYEVFSIPKLPLHKKAKIWFERRKTKAKGLTLGH